MQRRTGFTLTELLIVIAIIGMLAGLLIPAVQMAREAGRRTTCTNNQRNVALALRAKEGAAKRFPGYMMKNSDVLYGSWVVQISAELENDSIIAAWRKGDPTDRKSTRLNSSHT